MANARLVELTKYYKRGSDTITALDGVTLGIEKGEFVAVAWSMVNQPSVILLAEPSGAVDTETAQQLVDLLKVLNSEDQVTIVLVTHDTDIAGQARRQIRLKDGKVLTDERLAERELLPA